MHVILHSIRAVPLHLFGDMTIHIQGKGCCCVAQVALDCFYIVPIFDGNNSVLMAQIMKTHLWTAQLFDDPLEATIDCPIGKHTPLLVCEDKVMRIPVSL